jgi:hypothetical protein
MRTRLIAAVFALGAAGLVFAGEPEQAVPDPRDKGPGKIDVSAYPNDQRRNYSVYAGKCSKCHPLARSVNSHFNPKEWKRYLKRMLRRPNSGINEEQAAQIYDFLKFHATQQGY